ncbi:hypothetical protein [Nostoc sp.]
MKTEIHCDRTIRNYIYNFGKKSHAIALVAKSANMNNKIPSFLEKLGS